MERVCATPECGAVIPPQKGRSRPRKFCERCRPPRNQQPSPQVIQLPERSVGVGAPRGLVDAIRQSLEAAERLGTSEGAQALMLAEMLASGSHTASGAASLSRELRAALQDALAGAAKAADRLDELAARRGRKASG